MASTTNFVSLFRVAILLSGIALAFAGPVPPGVENYPTEPDYPNCDLITFPSPKTGAVRFDIPDDLLVEEDIEGETNDRNGVPDNKRWDGGRIPYAISDKFTEAERIKIMTAICEYDKKTQAVRFTPRKSANQKAFVFIDTKASGCSATVGMKGTGVQYVHLGPSCSLGSTMHELMHSAGFWHEQSRPDRNDFIEINWDNIQLGKEHNFLIRDTSTTFGMPYDYASQMHYSGKAFAKNSKVWTLRPRSPNSAATIGHRTGPSTLDIAKLDAMYPLCARGFSEPSLNGSRWTFTDQSQNNLEPVASMRSALIEPGCTLTICKNAEFRGGCMGFTGDDSGQAMFPAEWDNVAASYSCYCSAPHTVKNA